MWNVEVKTQSFPEKRKPCLSTEDRDGWEPRAMRTDQAVGHTSGCAWPTRSPGPTWAATRQPPQHQEHTSRAATPSAKLCPPPQSGPCHSLTHCDQGPPFLSSQLFGVVLWPRASFHRAWFWMVSSVSPPCLQKHWAERADWDQKVFLELLLATSLKGH